MTSSSPAVDYLRDVKPLLESKCYACHGAFKQQGGLRLDTAASLLLGGDSGSPIAVGNAPQSRLMDVLTGVGGLRMPPENEGSPLSEDEVERIRQWIDAGADAPDDETPQHDPLAWWSYRPLVRPSIPPVREGEWCRNSIDNFVSAERERHQLPHAAEATKSVWLRRVYIDLIGLPPTRDELHRFLEDDSATAYELVVDDLLTRPQYGERWGRHWMDIWRYSDWYGSRSINEIRYSQRHIWRWRDWIVRSLNADKGYDQMVREMLAADEIAPDDVNVLPATGFLGRNWYKFDRDVWMFETVERTAEAFLGLTLRCCRCHDHKFDPISQQDYYRFRAFFEPHDVRTDPVAVTTTEKDATLGNVLTDGIALVFDKEANSPTYRFERGDSRYPDKSLPLQPGVPNSLDEEPMRVVAVDLPPLAWYPMLRPDVRQTLIDKAEQAFSVADAKRITAEEALQTARAKVAAAQASAVVAAEPRVIVHDDFSKPKQEFWQTLSGEWVYQNNKLVETAVTDFATIVSKKDLPGDFRVRLRYRPLEAGGFRSIGFSFDYQDQGNSQDVYTSTNDRQQSVQAFHRVAGKQNYPPAGIVYTELAVGQEVALDVEVIGSRLSIDLNGMRKLEYELPVARREGKFALWVHQGAAEFLELKITELAESLDTLQRRERDAVQQAELSNGEVDIARAEKESVEKRVAAAVATHLGQDAPRARELAVLASRSELALALKRAEFELAKLELGNASQAPGGALLVSQQKVIAARQAADTPSEAFTPLGEQYPRTSTGRRSALANWIASPLNLRTARVAVNHLWGRHFGQHLVATPENFGLNGRQPTHPELLDWLATELIANDWSMKAIHRQIVLSSTYRMSSTANIEAAHALDPENVQLWRMNSHRMEAEVVRDSTLHLAGRLDMQFGYPELPETAGEDILRRSLYFRNTPNEKMPLLEVFDVADPNSCYRRKESVVPHQSLAMMNSGLVLDQARSIASQLPENEIDFLTAAFETILSRSPTTAETARCHQYLLDEGARRNNPSDEAFTQGGSAKLSPAHDPRLRSRENLVHVLLLHNDFVTVR